MRLWEIRTAWSEEEEKWYFSIIDVVSVLTESVDASAYWRKLKERLLKEGNETVTNCHTFKMRATDGKKDNQRVRMGHQKSIANAMLFCVPRAGIEPARYCYHRILSPARLPIPPSGQMGSLERQDCKFRVISGNCQIFPLSL